MPDAFGNPLPGEVPVGAPPPVAAAPPPPDSYPDMTPGVQPAPAILGTSWRKTGATEHGPAEPWQEEGTPVSRIVRAATDAYRNTAGSSDAAGNFTPSGRSPTILAPGAEDWLNRNLGPTGGAVANFIPRLIGTGIGDAAAIGAGGMQAINEGLRATGMSPALQRDLNILPQAISPALSEVSTAASALASNPAARTLIAEPKPSYTGGPSSYLKPADVIPPKPMTPTVQGLLGPIADGDVSSTGIPGPFGKPSGYTPPVITATTADEAHTAADALHTKAVASGASLAPDYTNRFVDKVTGDVTPPGPGTAAVAGPSDPAVAMAQRLQALKDKPLSITDVMGMDKDLNGQIRANINSNPSLAFKLQNMQDALRTQIDAATQADVGGGAEGFQAFSDWRDAYSQYKKMQNLEDIRDKAMGMEQPATAMQSNITKWATDPQKSRGLTDTEVAALKDAGERGYVGEIMRSTGGRLATQTAAPVIGGIAGYMSGAVDPYLGTLIGMNVGKISESVLSTAARRANVNSQLGKVSDALKVLGSKVPMPSDMPPPGGGP